MGFRVVWVASGNVAGRAVLFRSGINVASDVGRCGCIFFPTAGRVGKIVLGEILRKVRAIFFYLENRGLF